MSTKHRYAGKPVPDQGQRGLSRRFAGDGSVLEKRDGEAEACTCWLITRGEGNQTADRHAADCELVSDPACPVHGKKHYPILDDESWG